MTGTVLCAVDFSEDSEAALLWASQHAALRGARLVVLHVVHDPASAPGFYREPAGDWLRPMVDVATEMMNEFLDRVRAHHPGDDIPSNVETRLVQGLPASRIVEVAREIGAELIVLGSRGRTGLPHILLGSVAERVVQTAPMPVSVVKRPEATG